MADQYGLFWNSVSGDRTYDADSFSEWLGKFFTTGVFNGDLQVTPASGMVVNVGSGYANINGKVRFFDTDTSITISPASGVYPRIDTIVVRADYTNREIALAYVTGSYSGNNPQPTAPTRNASMYEIVLAQILVSAGSTEVTTASITDTRPDSTVCGWVTGTVDHVAVDQITEQAQAQFEAWFEHMKGQLSEDAAGNLQLQIDALDTRIDGIDAEIGDTDISTIGDGTVTGAVSALNNGLITFETTFEVMLASGTGRTNGQNAQFTSYTLTEKGLYLLSAETSGMNINGRTYAYFTGNNVIPSLSLYPATVNTEYYHKQIVQFVKVGNTPITVSLRYWDSNSIPEHKYKIYKILG